MKYFIPLSVFLFWQCIASIHAKYITPCPNGKWFKNRELVRCSFDATSVNNLGGFCSPPGTCSSSDPEVIRFTDACTVNGITFDVILGLAGKTTYDPIPAKSPTSPNTGGVNNNGVLGSMGQVNQRNGQEVDLQVKFVTSKGYPVKIAGEMVFANMNNGKCSCSPKPGDGLCSSCGGCEGARTFVSLPTKYVNGVRKTLPYDDRDYILPSTTSLCTGGTSSEIEMSSTTQGNAQGGTDNPGQIGADVWYEGAGLTPAQQNAGFGFIFPLTNSITFTWEVRNGDSTYGKNLVFGINAYTCTGPFL